MANLPPPPSKPTTSLLSKPSPSPVPSPVTVTVPVSVVENSSELIRHVPMAKSFLIYGESRTRKTTQLGLMAEWIYSEYGKPIRLITTEEAAGIDPIAPHIEAGLIDMLSVNETVGNPISLMRALSRGAWKPFKTVGGRQQLTSRVNNGLDAGEVGAYFIEGLATLSERLLTFAGVSQLKLQQEVAAAFQMESMIEGGETEKFGSPGQSHYLFVQNFVMALMAQFSMLPVEYVGWTGHEAKGDDESTKATIYGPGLVGKAATNKIPKRVGDLFHCQTFILPDKTETVKAWIRKHPDDQVPSILWPAGPRSAADVAPQLQSRWPEGAIDLNKESLVDFFKLKKSLKSDKTNSLRKFKEEIDARRKVAQP